MNSFLPNHACCLAAFNCVVIYHKHLDVGRGMARNNHLSHMGFQMHLFTHRGSLQKTFISGNILPWWQTISQWVIFMVWHFAVKVLERGYITFTGLLVSWSKVAGIVHDTHRLYWMEDLYETGLKWKLVFFNFISITLLLNIILVAIMGNLRTTE